MTFKERQRRVDFFQREIGRNSANGWDVWDVCALRLEKKLNKGNRGLFNLNKGRRYHTSHTSQTPNHAVQIRSANLSVLEIAGDFQE